MTQTANNYGEVLFELGIKKDTVEESKRIFSLTEQLHKTLESPIISKNEKYSIIEKVFPKEIENFLKVVCDHEKMSYIDEIIEVRLRITLQRSTIKKLLNLQWLSSRNLLVALF